MSARKIGAIGVLVVFAVLLLAVVARASTTSTPTSTVKPGQYLLHKADNNFPAPFDSKTGRFDTIELCQQGAEVSAKLAGVPVSTFKCDQSTGITVTMVQTSTCSDEPAPTIPLERDVVDGITYWKIPTGIPEGLTPPEPSEANGWATMVYAYVRNPKGDAAFPICWVRGFVPQDDWETNHNDPAKPFLQVKGQTPIKVAENSIEPTSTPDGFQEEWEGRQVAAAAACAAGDVKQCPQIPNEKPGACGWYYEPSCNNGVDPRAPEAGAGS